MTTRNKETKQVTNYCHNCNEEATVQVEEGEVLIYSIGDKEFWSHYILHTCEKCGCEEQTNTDCFIA